MSPDTARAAYARMMAAGGGEIVLFRRYTGAGSSRPKFEARVRARVTGYTPQELLSGNGLQQGDRKVILLADDLVAAQVRPPVKGDKLVIRGREVNIEAVDDNTRRIGAGLVAYELTVRG